MSGVCTTINHGYPSKGSQRIESFKNCYPKISNSFKELGGTKKTFKKLSNKLKLINNIFAIVCFVPLPSKWTIKYF